jgi:alkaline phosphatase
MVDPEDGGNHYGRRKDGRNLTAEWLSTRGVGSKFIYDKAGFQAADPATTSYLLGLFLFERSHMEYECDRPNDTSGEPSLSEMTKKAIQILSKSERGFYLHVESGWIDHAHHAGNPYRALTDTIELAKAVQMESETHSGEDVGIYASGPKAHFVHGVMEQNWIYHVMKEAFGL